MNERASEDGIDERIAAHFASIGQDEVRAAEIYAEDAVLEYIQSGERISGKANIIASRRAYPGRPASFELHRVVGDDATRVAELTLRFGGEDPHPMVAVLDLRDGLVVSERLYIAEPWDAPEYRARWVDPPGSVRPAPARSALRGSSPDPR
ncbi:MAG TPA: nuclear transport factor 2 family protein [Candidatus Limnocylindrales bacterium]|nr:nuclear transport factor 2 family protein [Candidatus Limnocylindrales bacterium]